MQCKTHTLQCNVRCTDVRHFSALSNIAMSRMLYVPSRAVRSDGPSARIALMKQFVQKVHQTFHVRRYAALECTSIQCYKGCKGNKCDASQGTATETKDTCQVGSTYAT